MLEIIVPVVLFLIIALCGWALVHTHRDSSEYQSKLAQRRSQLATAHLESGSAFGRGAAAALQREDFWTNPHCVPTGSRDQGLAWNAGWCYGRRQYRDASKEIAP